MSLVALPNLTAGAQDAAATEAKQTTDESTPVDGDAALDPASLVDPDRPIADRLADAFKFATEAKTHEQLDQVLAACRLILEESSDDDQKLYASQLSGWANFRHGDLWLDVASNVFESKTQPSDADGTAAESEDGEETSDRDEQHAAALDQAMSAFESALQDCPTLTRAEHGRGIVFSMRGEFETALKSFDRVVSQEPGFAPAHFNRAECCLELGQYPEAIKSYSVGLDFRPQDAAGYTGRGHAYYRSGDYQQALLDYRRTVQLEPHDPNALINRADAHLALGQWEKALEDYRQVRLIVPHDLVALQRLAWFKAVCPDVLHRSEPAAYELALLAIEQNGGRVTPLTMDTLAAAQAANGWFEDAVQTLELAQQLDPDKFSQGMEDRKKMYMARNPYYLQPLSR